jgi:hypothetical protein
MQQGTRSLCHAVEYMHTVELFAIEDSTASGTRLSTPMVSQTRPFGHGLHPEYSVTGISNALVVLVRSLRLKLGPDYS